MGMTLAQGTLAGQGVGAIASAYGAYSAANGQKYAMDTAAYLANNEAQLADINARLADNQAQGAMQAGQKREQSVLLKGAQVKSTQRAAMGANGVDMGGRSQVNILTSTDMMKTIDANQVAVDTLREAWGYRMQSTNYSNQANMLRAKASGYQTMGGAINPFVSAGTSLLGSATSIAQNYMIGKKVGMFDDPTSKEAGMNNKYSNVNYRALMLNSGLKFGPSTSLWSLD